MEMLPGYDDLGPDDLEGPGLGYDGSELLGRPGFWPAYLGEILGLDLDRDLAELFDDQLDAIRTAYQQLTDPFAWPIFPIELGGGRVAVVYRNFTEDMGQDYLVVPPDGEHCIKIATVEGALQAPGISWPELTAVADRQTTPSERTTVSLLLAPILGVAAAEAAEATARLAEALRVAGVTGQVTTIAEGIVSAFPAEWGRTADGIVVCWDEGSTRNPGGPAALKPAALATVSDLLAGAPTAPQ
jgi:hypothetical protein